MHLVYFAVVIAVIATVTPIGKFHRALYGGLVVSIVVLPKALTAINGSQYVGIATRSPTFYAFSLTAVVFGLGLALRHSRDVVRGLLPWLPFLLLILWYWRSSWPRDDVTKSGLIQICTGIIIFALSYAATRVGIVDSLFFSRVFSYCVLVQAIAVFSDLLSKPIYTAKSAVLDGTTSRIVGFTNNSEILAQVILICLTGILAWEPITKYQRVLQGVSVAVSVIIVALTQGRVAFLATLLTIVVLAILQSPTRSGKSRKLLIAMAVIVSLASLSSIISRFQTDPGGGERQHLTSVAYTVMSHMPTSGFGLNQYVQIVGGYDPLVGSGVPVHNVYLLLFIETGYLAGTFFWLPLLVVAVIAWRSRKRVGAPGVVARVVLASIPGILLTSYEGWSLPSTPLFELFCVVYGGLFGLMSATKNRNQATSRNSKMTREAAAQAA